MTPHFDPRRRAESFSPPSSEGGAKTSGAHPITRFIRALLGQHPTEASVHPAPIKATALTEEKAREFSHTSGAAGSASTAKDTGAGAIPHLTLEEFVALKPTATGESDGPLSSPPSPTSSMTSDPGSIDSDPASISITLASASESLTPNLGTEGESLIRRSTSTPEVKVSRLTDIHAKASTLTGADRITENTSRIAEEAIRRSNSDITDYRPPKSQFSIGHLFRYIFGKREPAIAPEVAAPAAPVRTWRIQFSTPRWLVNLFRRKAATPKLELPAISSDFRSSMEANCEQCGLRPNFKHHLFGHKISIAEPGNLQAQVQTRYSLAHISSMILDQFIPQEKHISAMFDHVKTKSHEMGLDIDFSCLDTVIPAEYTTGEAATPCALMHIDTLKALREKDGIDETLKGSINQYIYLHDKLMTDMVCLKLYDPQPSKTESIDILTRLLAQVRDDSFTISPELSTHLDHIDEAQDIVHSQDIEPAKQVSLTATVLSLMQYLPTESYQAIYHAFETKSDPCAGLYELNKMMLSRLNDPELSKAPGAGEALELGPDEVKREFMLVLIQMAKDRRFDLLTKILTLDPTVIEHYDGTDPVIADPEKYVLGNTLLHLSEGAWRLLGVTKPNTDAVMDLFDRL